MITLPENFLAEMKVLMNDEFNQFMDSYNEDTNSGIRINTAKISPDHFKELFHLTLDKIPWIPNGYFYENDQQLSKHPFYAAGLYYIQEPSAMTPASLLPVTPGDRVLDLCAAPGGKATELGAKLNNRGVLVANDISNSRAKALLKNLELFGIPNIMVCSESSDKLKINFPEWFDAILIDAPCSGEGMFRRDPKMVRSYIEKGSDYYSDIQKQLIRDGADMLRPGGYLLYSTCTFSVQENEAVIQYLLDTNKDMELVPIADRYSGFVSGKPELIDNSNPALKECVRIFPHKMKGEGHFAALLHKVDKTESSNNTNVTKHAKSKIKIPESLHAFLNDCNISYTEDRLLQIKEQWYLLPDNTAVVKNIRYLRTGLYLGSLNKAGLFEPSQALAMYLSAEQYPYSLQFDAADSYIMKYLKGETIEHPMSESIPKNKWVLICVEQWPLGWCKMSGGILKNKYYTGWRWQ